MDEDIERLIKIIAPYRALNFVKRMESPDIYPVLPDYEGPGTWGTHLMVHRGIDNKRFLYPEIIQDETGNLRQLPPDEALAHALKTKEYIPFNTFDEAEWFGKNYKRLWGGEFNK